MTRSSFKMKKQSTDRQLAFAFLAPEMHKKERRPFPTNGENLIMQSWRIEAHQSGGFAHKAAFATSKHAQNPRCLGFTKARIIIANSSSQQSRRCKSNTVKGPLIDSSVSTAGDINMACASELTASPWIHRWNRSHLYFQIQTILCRSQT